MNTEQWCVAFFAVIHRQAEKDGGFNAVEVLQALATLVSSVAKSSPHRDELLALFSQTLETLLNNPIVEVTVQ